MESSGPQKRLSHERISACELDMSSVWIFESLWYETEDGRERVTESIFHGSAKCITYLGGYRCGGSWRGHAEISHCMAVTNSNEDVASKSIISVQRSILPIARWSIRNPKFVELRQRAACETAGTGEGDWRP